MKSVSIFQNLIENPLFQNKHLLIQLNFLMTYINFKDNIVLKPMSINIKDNVMDIAIGVPTNNFLYVNIYKKQIIGKLSRYFYSQYVLNLTLIPVF